MHSFSFVHPFVHLLAFPAKHLFLKEQKKYYFHVISSCFVKHSRKKRTTQRINKKKKTERKQLILNCVYIFSGIFSHVLFSFSIFFLFFSFVFVSVGFCDGFHLFVLRSSSLNLVVHYFVLICIIHDSSSTYNF